MRTDVAIAEPPIKQDPGHLVWTYRIWRSCTATGGYVFTYSFTYFKCALLDLLMYFHIGEVLGATCITLCNAPLAYLSMHYSKLLKCGIMI